MYGRILLHKVKFSVQGFVVRSKTPQLSENYLKNNFYKIFSFKNKCACLYIKENQILKINRARKNHHILKVFVPFRRIDFYRIL